MTTQQPTQPEAPESPLSDRVSRLEAIAEETHLRLAENHADHQTHRAEILALGEKVDRQGESLNAKIDTKVDTLRAEMNDKIDRQGEALRAEINKQGEIHRAEIKALSDKIDRLLYMMLGAFVTTWATIAGALFLAG